RTLRARVREIDGGVVSYGVKAGIRKRAVRRHRFGERSPAAAELLEDVGNSQRMLRRRTVVLDPLCRTRGHRDVVRETWMSLGVEARRDTALIRDGVDVRGIGRADDLGKLFVLEDDPND